MGCMVCNPFCGRCRPPQPHIVRCPECGKLVMRGRREPWTCPQCGAALPPREKLRCNWTGMLCDIPCMRNIRENPSGELHDCPWAEVKKSDWRPSAAPAQSSTPKR